MLATSEVVSQTSLEVGSSPYLLLLSEEEHLDVYRYIPLEVSEKKRRKQVKYKVHYTYSKQCKDKKNVEISPVVFCDLLWSFRAKKD